MVHHVCPRFLENKREYQRAVRHWEELWSEFEPLERELAEWRSPWMANDPIDGNPIFTAFSPILRRGIRVIQHAPSSGSLELDYWLDTFGGKITDPRSGIYGSGDAVV